MSETQVKVNSITYAAKGKKILTDNGFKAYIRRSRKIEKGEGCGYSIYFAGDRDKGLALLKNYGIKLIGVAEP